MHRSRVDCTNYMRKYRYMQMLRQRMERGETCAKCGMPVEVLHHLDENQANNRPANLQNLCRPCHLDTPHTVDREPDFPLRGALAPLHPYTRAEWRQKTVTLSSSIDTVEETVNQDKNRYVNLTATSPSKHFKIAILQCSRRVVALLQELGYHVKQERV